jgi:hypothetical protein
MDLIDRYLDTVRLLLPAAQRDDIVAELRDVLISRREDRAAELGRPLKRGEEEDLLRDFGHPIIVAGRYGPQRYLVGPELYPVYAFVVKIVLAAVAAGALVVGVVAGTLAHASLGHALGAAIGVIWSGAFTAVGVVTMVFWVLQLPRVRAKLVIDWDPRDLPRIQRRRRRAGWPDHVAGIVVQTIFLLWWLGLVQPWRATLPVNGGGALQIAFAPVWGELYWPVAGLAVGVIVVNALKLMGPTRRRLAYGVDLVLQLLTAGVASFALRASHWAVVTGAGVKPSTVAAVDRGVNIGVQVTLAVIICVAVCSVGYHAWRLYRPQPADVGKPSAPRNSARRGVKADSSA